MNNALLQRDPRATANTDLHHDRTSISQFCLTSRRSRKIPISFTLPQSLLLLYALRNIILDGYC